jgi:hypothetical protein
VGRPPDYPREDPELPDAETIRKQVEELGIRTKSQPAVWVALYEC